MTFTPKFHNLKHSWNSLNQIGIKFLDNDKKDCLEFLPANWYFGIQTIDLATAKTILTNRYYSTKKDVRFPEYTMICCNDIRSGDNEIQNKYDLVLELEKAGIETFEGDLLPDRRFYIDNEVQIETNIKKLYFDIETDDTEGKLEIGRDFIISFSAIDNLGKIYFKSLKELTEESEKELLTWILKVFKRYDLILGWNSSGFDVPYLKSRMKKYELNRTTYYQWRQWGHFDLLKRFRHIFRFDSYIRSFSLDSVSKHFLGKGKIPHNEKIIDLWKTNKKKLREYNIEDSVLTKELDEKLGVSDMMIRQCSWCGVPISQFGLYSIIDAYILRTAHRNKKMCKTSLNAIKERSYKNERAKLNPDETDTNKAKYIGAAVLEPKTGIYNKVYTFDFKGLYPSMMRTSNIGYDTIRFECHDDCIINPGTNNYPRKDGQLKPTFFIKEKSVINLAISDLITKRKEYKELKLKMIEEGKNKGPEWQRIVSDEIIVKELANSTYGIMGLEYGRYYSIDVAESITLFGQWCLSFARKFFESLGYNVIYGDTDSIFVSTEGKTINTEEVLKHFHEKLELMLKTIHYIDEIFIQLEFDKEYEKFILIAKKTYVGHVINIEHKKVNETYARGLDFLKKNTFKFAAEKQRELIELILKTDYSLEIIQNWLKSSKQELYEKNFNQEDLTITQRVGKPLNEYKKTAPLHVRLAQKLNEQTGQNLLHTEIEYIITNHSKLMDGVLAENYIGNFDREYYWTNKTEPIFIRVLEIIFPNVDWEENMKPQRQLKLL